MMGCGRMIKCMEKEDILKYKQVVFLKDSG